MQPAAVRSRARLCSAEALPYRYNFSQLVKDAPPTGRPRDAQGTTAPLSEKGNSVHRILAVGDIHQSPNLDQIEAAIDRVNPDITVFIGDYFDSFVYDHHDHVRRTAFWLKEGLQREDRIYLLGNHDLPYAFPHLTTCPGWTAEKHRVVRTVLEDSDWRKFQLSYSPNTSWLFTHAGISRRLVPPGQSNVPLWFTTECEIGMSYLSAGRPHWIFQGGTRRGENRIGGPLWCSLTEFEPVEELNQVFGHTPANRDQPLIRQMIGRDSVNFCIDACCPDGVKRVLLLEEGVPTEISI